jgi:methionyl-tRNA synthetase
MRMLVTAEADPAAKPPFYVTTPIYYVNWQPHIGHAYTTLACDVLARFKRLDGHEVKFLTGTDEHGQKVEQSANAAGETPQAFADRVSATFRELLGTYDFTNDGFIRTTETRHREAAQALWRRLVDAGDIYLDVYEGWYSVRDECFYGEDELIDGAAPTGAPVEWVAESSFFFRLSAYKERLEAYITDNPEFINPAGRRNEVLAFMREGLRDLSISRCA